MMASDAWLTAKIASVPRRSTAKVDKRDEQIIQELSVNGVRKE